MMSTTAEVDASTRARGDVSTLQAGGASTPAAVDTSTRTSGDVCGWCKAPLRDVRARYCSKQHRQNAWKFARQIRRGLVASTPKRLAYADPPYPGRAHLYRGHPDYAGEVDHAALLSTLEQYDGWALSTDEPGLRHIEHLLAGREHRIGVWVRGARPGPSSEPLRAWEAVIYRPARAVVSTSPAVDVLVHTARPRPSDPQRVIGAKPPAFCDWLFELLAARVGDSFADLFPGSGGVARAWSLFNRAE